jgi:hypothetical protein
MICTWKKKGKGVKERSEIKAREAIIGWVLQNPKYW